MSDVSEQAKALAEVMFPHCGGAGGGAGLAEVPAMSAEAGVWLEIYRDPHSGGLQVSISEIDDSGFGDGYRIFGPKFCGESEVLRRHRLTKRDADEIRHYLDAVEADQ